MGRLLRETNLTPDLILSSTATRALSTAEAVAEASGYARGVTTSRDLYLAEPAGYLIALSAVPQTCQRVLLVGHNPTMERFLAQMTGTSEELPTAALALIELPIERWDELGPEIRGRLRQVWRPRELETS